MAVALAHLTAATTLSLAGFQAGKTVLAPAIGGSVGNAVTQVARASGAKQAISSTTSHAKALEAKAFGFDEVIDGSSETLSDGVRRITGGPRDGSVFLWLMFVGGAKVNLGRYEEAIVWLNRSIEVNRNNPLCHFHLAGTYALLGRLEEARIAARTGLALNPDFTVARFRASRSSDNARRAAAHELFADALRAAGAPDQ